MAWQSGDPKIHSSKRRLRDGWARGIGKELSSLHSNEQGKLLLLGELILIWSETLPGRFLIAIGALFLAWLLL